MATVMFHVSRWPSNGRLLDALKYGSDPSVKFRVDFTIIKSGCNEQKITDVQVLGYVEEDVSGTVMLYLKLHSDITYFGHSYRGDATVRGDAAVKCWVNVQNRARSGIMHLTEI